MAYIQAPNAYGEPLSNRPRFSTTVPTGVFLRQPSKETSSPTKVRYTKTYAYFSIPKVFVQNLNGKHKEDRVTEIRPIVATTTNTFGKLQKLR